VKGKHLGDECVVRTVVQDEGAAVAAVGVGHLVRGAGCHGIKGRAVARRRPRKAHRSIGLHANHRIAAAVGSTFEQNCRLAEHIRRAACLPLLKRLKPLPHRRMHEGIQGFQLGVIPENAGRELPPVYTIGREHIRTPAAGHCSTNRVVLTVNGPSGRICIEHRNPERPKHPGYRAFAGTYSAGQAYDSGRCGKLHGGTKF
jgi:hypothetical protein